MTAKLWAAPPSIRQMEDMALYLKQSLFIEHAAALAGITRKQVLEWIKLGRQGKAAYVPFVEMIDKQNAELASALMTPIMNSVKEGDLKAAAWVYSKRIGPYADQFRKQEAKIEEEAELAAPDAGPDEADVLAAEARVMAQLEEIH